MKKYSLCLAFCFLCHGIHAQNTFSIFGKVIDSAGRQPLVGASVFCPNTTHGTVSNNEGLFFLRLPAGGYDLVISYTGYEKKIIRISNNQPNTDTLRIELSKEDKSLTEVAVVATNEVADGWSKYGKFFLNNFIGTTPNAAQCQLKNPEALHFFYSKKRNRLKVMSKEELLVMNYALGYAIRYQLDSFSYDYTSNVSQFTGYPLFSEIDTSAQVKEQWFKNRAKTYLGSRLHFMRTLYDSLVNEEGFVVEKLGDDPNGIKGTVISNLYDSSLYLADSGNVDINWNGRYRISYRLVRPEKKYLEELKLPLNSNAQVSLLSISDGFVIEENGYFYEQSDVVNSGYWAWKKLAELLPHDYTYE